MSKAILKLFFFFILFFNAEPFFAQTTAKEWMDKALEYRNDSNNDSAKICCDKALQIEPNNVDALLNRMLLNLEVDYEHEVVWLLFGYSPSTWNGVDLYEIGEEERISSQIKDIDEDFEKIIKLDPSKLYDCLLYRANAQYSHKAKYSHNEQLRHTEKLLDRYPNDFVGLLLKAYHLSLLNKPKEAIDIYTQIIENKTYLKSKVPFRDTLNYPTKQKFAINFCFVESSNEPVFYFSPTTPIKKGIEENIIELRAIQYLRMGNIKEFTSDIKKRNGVCIPDLVSETLIDKIGQKRFIEDYLKGMPNIFGEVQLTDILIEKISFDSLLLLNRLFPENFKNGILTIQDSCFNAQKYKEYLEIGAKEGSFKHFEIIIKDKSRDFSPGSLYEYAYAWYKLDNLENALEYLNYDYLEHRKRWLKSLQSGNTSMGGLMGTYTISQQVKLHYFLFDIGVQTQFNSDTSINLTIQFLQEMSRKKPEQSDYCKTTIADLRSKSMKYYLESCEKAVAKKEGGIVYSAVKNAENMYKELQKYKLESEYTQILSDIYVHGIKIFSNIAKEEAEKKLFETFYSSMAIDYFDKFKKIDIAGKENLDLLMSDTYFLGATAALEKGNRYAADRWSKESLALNPSNKGSLELQKKLAQKATIDAVKKEAKNLLKGVFKKN